MKIRIIISFFLVANLPILSLEIKTEEKEKLFAHLPQFIVDISIHSQKIVEAINSQKESDALYAIQLELEKIDNQLIKAVINNLSHYPVLNIFSEKCTALYFACERGYLSVVQFLIENGADVNKRNDESSMTPLMISAKKKFVPIFTYLLKNGANSKLAVSEEDGSTKTVSDFIKDSKLMQEILARHTSTCEIL